MTFLSAAGDVYTQLSPMAANTLSKFFLAAGLKPLLQGYFEDEPCISFRKSVLRRTQPLKAPADWHQDGAFMNSGIKSLNFWMSLTDCGTGTQSPGMDLIPRRLNEVVKPGTNGAAFDWTVSPATIK